MTAQRLRITAYEPDGWDAWVSDLDPDDENDTPEWHDGPNGDADLRSLGYERVSPWVAGRTEAGPNHTAWFEVADRPWRIEKYRGDATRQPLDARAWTAEGLCDDNAFGSAEHAAEALDALLGGAWREGWYRIVSDAGDVWWEGADACVYCGSTRDPENEPPVIETETGDAEWARRAQLHEPGCEWIETRAHTLGAA